MWIAIIIIALVLIMIISIYNGLIKSQQQVSNAWSQISVQLQRRFDLIPNLVETTKAYSNFEAQTLQKVTELRTAWANSSSVSEKAKLDTELSGALKTIMAVSENYPDLKANTQFTELMEELRSTENKIAYSRQFYNDSVTRYNTKLSLFPSNIIASMFNFKAKELFETENEDVKKNVKVNFDN